MKLTGLRRNLLVLAALGIAAAAVAAYLMARRPAAPHQLVLYGNVDLRQVDVAFNGSERIAEVLVQEGDEVHSGQVLAKLDTSRLEPQVAQARAQVAGQKAVVERMHNGSRPQEIAQARANLAAAKADSENARRLYDRAVTLFGQATATQQDLDNTRAALDVAEAKVEVNAKALDLALAGPRAEDIAQAEAQLAANRAQLALVRRQLADATLAAPVDGIIRSRLMEPGEMASPQRPVFAIAITDPKWVRAYVAETDLPHLHPGMDAAVEVDGFPGRRFAGWVGFISPVAEFTPKTVQTEELRSSLVYEIRVFVKDANDNLRLGMPATVYLTPDANAPSSSGAAGRP